MSLDLRTIVLGYNGEPFNEVLSLNPDGTAKEQRPLTLRQAFLQAINSPLEGDPDTFDSKMERFLLSERIYKEDSPALDVAELATIRERSAKVYPPVVVGRIAEVIQKLIEVEPAPKPRGGSRARAGT